MAQRLVLATVADVAADKVDALLTVDEELEVLRVNHPGPTCEFRFTVEADRLDEVLDPLQQALAGYAEFRVLVLPIETVIPRPSPPPEPLEPAKLETEEKLKRRSNRIGRDELLTRLDQAARLDRSYLVMVLLSTVVAVLGLTLDDIPLLIGAMVIAPLLGPNIALALSSTMADRQLASRSLRTNLAGVAIAIGASMLMGLLFELPLDTAAMAARATLDLPDLAVALAAGAAGAMAYSSGTSGGLVGVMVAVALLPPLTAASLYLAGGDYPAATGAALLLLGNLVSLNLAGIVVFLARGYAPREWWRKASSRKVARRMLAWWFTLFVALAFFAHLASQG
jgi:uncharacterized hydrophobic protein (TIGR00341 family)